jgi:hypothetical protein
MASHHAVAMGDLGRYVDTNAAVQYIQRNFSELPVPVRLEDTHFLVLGIYI